MSKFGIPSRRVPAELIVEGLRGADGLSDLVGSATGHPLLTKILMGPLGGAGYLFAAVDRIAPWLVRSGAKALLLTGHDHRRYRSLYFSNDRLYVVEHPEVAASARRAGTRDTGLSVTRLSFQITHATDSDTNAERDFIVGELRKNRSIEAMKVYQAGESLLIERVNRYITDGKVTLAILAACSQSREPPSLPHELP